MVVYIFTLFLGIWHAFPNTDVVGDESPYVWDVLTSLESKTLIPLMDYSYSLSFYANYALMTIVRLLFFGGNIASLSSYLNSTPWIFYLLPRFVSVIATALLLYFFLRLAKHCKVSFAQRLGAASLIFTNIIFAVIAHTGKMWLLSLLLFFLSFYFLTEAFYREKELTKIIWYRNPIFYSIIFAFLSLANFPFNIIALLNIVYIYYFFYRPSPSLRSLIIYSTITSLFLFLITFLLNYHGWVTQNSANGPGSLDALPAFIWSYLIIGSLIVMPWLLLSLFNVRKILEKKPFWIVTSYLVSYILLLALRATWVGAGPAIYWRYLIYPVFFVGLMLLFVEIRSRYLLYFCR